MVFGQAAGVQCARYMMDGRLQKTWLSKLSGADVRDAAFVDGGGLAGVSAAKAMLENRDKTVLLDKVSFCGGDAHSEADTRIEGWPQKKFQGLTPKSMQRT